MPRRLLAITVAAIALGGCTAAPEPAPAPSPASSVVSAEETCTQYGNRPGTLLVNAWNQFDLGITTEAEREQAVADAWAALREIEVEPGSVLEEKLVALQAFPVEELPRDFVGSIDWQYAVEGFSRECAANGTEVAVTVWNGG